MANWWSGLEVDAKPAEHGGYRSLFALAGLDKRSLAVFRMGLGLVLLVDLLKRARDLAAHYSDVGAVPRQVLLDWRGDDAGWSFHLLSGSTMAQAVLFTVAAGFAVAMLLGYRTQLATVFSWLFLCSLHGRNPAVLHGGDNLLRVLLFWAMFVPLAEVWALDARRRAERWQPLAVSVGTLALGLQLCFLYWFAGWLKWDPAWTRDGIAVYQALSLDQLVTPWGHFLLRFPRLLTWATWGTLVLEFLGPFLVFIPWRTAFFRTLAVGLFVSFHLLGLGLALNLGIFPWVCAIAWTIFLPAAFWDSLSQWTSMQWTSMQWTSMRWTAGRAEGAVQRRPALGWGTALMQLGVAGLLALTLLWNLRTVDEAKYGRALPEPLKQLILAVRLDQRWNLFAPYPSLDDGWYVMPGRLADGSELDVFTGRAVSWDKPEVVSFHLGNERWRKFLMNLWAHNHAPLRRSYAQALCRSWNAEADADHRLERFQMFYLLEWTVVPGYAPPGGEPLPAEPPRHLLWTQICLNR